MPETPPTQANYPRGSTGPDEADRLIALSEGYYGLNIVFLINVVLLFAVSIALAFTVHANGLVRYAICTVVVGTVVAFLSYPQNRKIGFGAGWSTAGPGIASFLMGLNSAFCCGIIGYVVVQNLALNNMKKYGIKPRFLGPKKADVFATAERLRSQANNSGYPRP